MSWLKRKLPKKRWQRALIYIVSLFLVLLALDMALVQYWRRVTISPETTYITSPLNKDGYPDYVAALDAKCREGVTRENNAAVLLLQAVDTKELPPKWAKHVWPALGIKDPPAKVCLKSFKEWADANPPSDGKVDDAADNPQRAPPKPWTRAQKPRWGAYLEAQREPLELALAASRREKFYVPLIAPDSDSKPGATLCVPLPYLLRARDAQSLICMDAMLALGEGNFDRSRERLLASLRLARLLSRGPMLLDYLVGLALETRAQHTVRAITAAGSLAPGQLQNIGTVLAELPPLGSPAEVIGTGDRYMRLDALCWVAKDGPAVFEPLGGSNAFAPLAGKVWPININAGLRHVNTSSDAMVGAIGLKDYQASRRALLENERVFRRQPSLRLLIAEPHLLISMILDPALTHVREKQEQVLVEQDLTNVALTLARYRATHESYPDKLELPRDRFAADGRPLTYRRDGSGYILYSVGPDGTDDGGVTRARGQDKPWDIVHKVEK